MPKIIKFFFTKNISIDTNKKIARKNILKYFLFLLYLICFQTGKGVLKATHFLKIIFSKLKNAVLKEFKTTYEFGKLRINKLLNLTSYKNTGLFFILIFLVIFFTYSARTIAYAIFKKDMAINLSLKAITKLEDAKKSIETQNFSKSEQDFYLAAKTFQTAQYELDYSQKTLNSISNLIPKKASAKNLLTSAQLLSEAGADFSIAVSELKQISFVQSGLVSEKPLPKTLAEVKKYLILATEKTVKTEELLNNTSADILPNNFKSKFLDIKKNISLVNIGLKSVNSFTDLFIELVTNKKNVLIIFQNNNELRPTGGFIGTFGNFKIENGKIGKIHISSVYDLDGQLLEKIQPPKPILNVNKFWYLRDSNWFADFSKSAKKISQFFEKEGGETPDIIIALTPNMVIDLLKITGPIDLPKYNLTLNSDNFIEQTQFFTSNSEKQNSPNAPKQILADFFNIFIQKLTDLPNEKWVLVIKSLQDNLISKNLLAYSIHQNIQNKLEEYNWAGKVLNSNGDYLQIVTANLDGTKTDLSIEQTASLKVKVDNLGNIVNELTITRTNKLPDIGLLKNLSFVRIFVPLGSELLYNEGFLKRQITEPMQKYDKIDSDVQELEKKSVQEINTGTTISQESEKTVFGNWIETKGGESKTFKVVYKLPFSISSIGNYSLLLQKQPGTLSMPVEFMLEFLDRTMKWSNFTPDSKTGNLIKKRFVVDRDNFFGIVLIKND
jgi:hypothetical protein